MSLVHRGLGGNRAKGCAYRMRPGEGTRAVKAVHTNELFRENLQLRRAVASDCLDRGASHRRELKNSVSVDGWRVSQR